MCATAFQQGLSSADNTSSSIPYLYTPAAALAWNATPGLLDASYAYTSGMTPEDRFCGVAATLLAAS